MPLPPNVIPAPDPGPLRYGIFTPANGPLSMPDRVRQSGVTYDPVGCGTARGYPVECDETPPTKVFDPNVGEQTAIPFVVYASLVCGTAGYDPDYLEAKVRRRLLAVEQTGVEEALWSGAIGGVTLGNSPTFQGGGVTTLTAVTGLAAGIGALEDYAAAVYGYRPVIHAETKVAALAGQATLVEDDDPAGILRTPLGSAWSFGGGYPGTSPAGAAAAAGHVWLMATGQVTLWRSESIYVSPALQTMDRASNQFKLIAEREWLAAADCFVAAVDVTL